MGRKAPRESDEDIWFEPKQFGYGAGLPVAWQGWALLGGYIVLVSICSALVEPAWEWQPVLAAVPMIAILALSVALMTICARHTRGGWRWRWGKRN